MTTNDAFPGHPGVTVANLPFDENGEPSLHRLVVTRTEIGVHLTNHTGEDTQWNTTYAIHLSVAQAHRVLDTFTNPEPGIAADITVYAADRAARDRTVKPSLDPIYRATAHNRARGEHLTAQFAHLADHKGRVIVDFPPQDADPLSLVSLPEGQKHLTIDQAIKAISTALASPVNTQIVL